jgi:DMSO/TMAO reductase YedYZ molybdopterin-dependent catalytic subunit
MHNMKKSTAILAAAIVMIVVLVAAASIYLTKTTSNVNQLPTGEPTQWQINVTGDVNEEKTWTLNEISKMPLTDVIVKSENATYRGVALSEFCNKTGIIWDAGPIDIIDQSGQSATLNIYQAWNSTNYPYGYDYNVMVLAFIKDGKWLNDDAGGPVKLIAPTFADNYQVEKVAEIHSQPWTVSITGNVANPLTITGKNLTAFQPETLRGEFRPGGEPNRTSDWTGLPILDVLQTAKASVQAKQITVIGIDGYTKNFTLDQVRDGQMLIGYQENGQPLPTSQGGPFRLFAPTEAYKWGQYWVKYIQEIQVT